jgi:hypothetical protein
MAKKGETTTAKVEESKGPEGGFGEDETAGVTGLSGINIDTDFSIEDEWKPTPLIPNGRYNANVTEVKFDEKEQALRFTFCLADNGGVMSDGETPIDGVTIVSSVYFPKSGDEKEMTKDGKQTKRAGKISMMKQFGDKMKINLNSPKAIIQALTNQEWVGISAMLTIGTREWEGRVFNDIKDVKAA